MSQMNAEQIKFYETEVKGFAEMYFRKDARLSMINEKLRESIRTVWVTFLRQTRADFSCSTCIDTMIRHSYAIYQNSKANLKVNAEKQPASVPVQTPKPKQRRKK